MKTQRQGREKLVVGDSQMLVWVVAALFLGVGLLAVSIPALVSESGWGDLGVPWNIQVLVVAVGAFCTFAAIRTFYLVRSSLGIFDRVSGTVTISSRRVFCPERRATMSFSDISSAVLVETPDKVEGVRREILLTLRSGQRVRLSELSVSTREEALSTQREIQAFLFQPQATSPEMMIH